MSWTGSRQIMKLAWFTDLHLDLVDETQMEPLVRSAQGAEVILSGGDLGQAETFAGHLVKLSSRFNRPVYFVLGNHDFYGSSFADTQQRAKDLSRYHSHLHWLPEQGVVQLTEETALIGRGLFGDGRLGNAERSKLVLADHRLIEDLVSLDRDQLFKKLNELGDKAASWTREHLGAALKSARKVIVLSHVPPFDTSGKDRGRAAGGEALPFYTCAAVGEVLLELMEAHPDKELTVLCGHTHTAVERSPTKNITVITGGVRYGEPWLQRMIEV